MMSEQEMQFADPDWQSDESGTAWPPNSENDLPRPVKAGRYTWQSEEKGPSSSAFSSLYEQGYQGQRRMLVSAPAYEQAPSRMEEMGVRPNTRQRFWLWLVVLLFLILLVPTLCCLTQ